MTLVVRRLATDTVRHTPPPRSRIAARVAVAPMRCCRPGPPAPRSATTKNRVNLSLESQGPVIKQVSIGTQPSAAWVKKRDPCGANQDCETENTMKRRREDVPLQHKFNERRPQSELSEVKWWECLWAAGERGSLCVNGSRL